ncbi:MAG: hypothetical protein J2P46_08120 [Zavarzinella sp.]|nr:hypothetical protein [Zavarzinella sp.]
MADPLDELGRSVTRAVRFLREVFGDVVQMFEALDGLMADQGWRPTEKTRLSYGLSNGMDPTGWVADCLFRFYFLAATGTPFLKVIGFVVRCVPDAGYDQPVMLGVAAHFPAATDWVTVYNAWKSSGPAIEGLAATPGPRLLTADEADPLIPGAESVVGLTVPVCRLTAAAQLRSAVVDHLLAAVV